MSDCPSRPISTESENSLQLTKKKYAKLTPEVKQLFLHKLIFENKSIKDAAQELRINYSSAKAITSSHKKLRTVKPKKSKQWKNMKTASYK